MKINKFLISKKELEDYKKYTGRSLRSLKYSKRRTGRSTILMLEIIAQAMKNPGKNIKIIDHQPSNIADIDLMYRIQCTITKLDLQGFTLNEKNHTIKFNLYEE